MVLKVNLSWKLFGFFVKAVVIIAIMVGAVYFSASRDFENYVREFEQERFEPVVGILEDEKANYPSWETNSLDIKLLNLNQVKRYGVFWCY